VTLLSSLALAVALLVVVPYFAHRLRRKRADEQLFPPASLVTPTPPRARRRSKLEDRALLAVRTVSVVGLALLGATPFVRCSRLSLRRSAGASVAMAIVIDDSMSMRAPAPAGSTSRFDRALRGARELLASASEGDAVAIVLAGSSARVALAATTDLDVARGTIDALRPSDRATDLDGAIALARSAVGSLPQVDKRVVLLSDLSDGNRDGPPIGGDEGVPVWVALPELATPLSDCAILRADQAGQRVRVSVACGPGVVPVGRSVVVEDAKGTVLTQTTLDATSRDMTLPLDADTTTPVRARLTGQDAIATDDVAPVVHEAARSAVAVVADSAEDAVATGGAPVVEQAIAALKLDVDLRPLPAFPDRKEDLAGDVGVVLDDPPGLTPEQRHVLSTFVEGGGSTLVALGPRAAAAPLGASLEPVLAHPVAWSETRSPGADAKTTSEALAEASGSLADLAAPRRATLAPEDSGAFQALVKWTDGAPLVARRAQGRGEVWIATLPFSAQASDLPLRPAFLSILDVWVRAARERVAPQRSEVGTIWQLSGAQSVAVEGPAGKVVPTREGGVPRVVPAVLGAYRVTIDGKDEVRVAMPVEREIDLRPRAATASASGQSFGENRAAVDISGEVALALLALAALELALRVITGRGRAGDDGLATAHAPRA
jgi:hypothetical protein